jgi:hypothetical protein
MAVALTALFVALGGTSMAAVLITGADIKDGSITGRDVKDRSLGNSDVINKSLRGNKVADSSLGGSNVINESLRGRDIKDGTIGSTDIGDHSLTGTDINQSTLGSVPSAGGVTPKRFSLRVAPGTAEQKVLDLQGFQLFAACPSSGVPTIRATTTAAGSDLQGNVVRGNGTTDTIGSSAFAPGQSIDISNGAQRGSGTLAFAQPSNGIGTTVAFGFDGGTNASALNGCVVNGTAFGG